MSALDSFATVPSFTCMDTVLCGRPFSSARGSTCTTAVLQLICSPEQFKPVRQSNSAPCLLSSSCSPNRIVVFVPCRNSSLSFLAAHPAPARWEQARSEVQSSLSLWLWLHRGWWSYFQCTRLCKRPSMGMASSAPCFHSAHAAREHWRRCQWTF